MRAYCKEKRAAKTPVNIFINRYELNFACYNLTFKHLSGLSILIPEFSTLVSILTLAESVLGWSLVYMGTNGGVAEGVNKIIKILFNSSNFVLIHFDNAFTCNVTFSSVLKRKEKTSLTSLKASESSQKSMGSEK